MEPSSGHPGYQQHVVPAFGDGAVQLQWSSSFVGHSLEPPHSPMHFPNASNAS